MRFRTLDSLRGIAALLVLLFHIEIVGALHSGHLHGLKVITHSFMMVDFFFVLSGFVISHTYFSKLENNRDIYRFVIRRFGRVYPLHLLMLLGFIALELLKLYLLHRSHFSQTLENAPFTGSYSLYSLFTNILLLQSLNLHGVGTWNSPSWSISTEFYTYILFAILAVKLRKNPRSMILLSAAISMLGLSVVAVFSPRYIDTIYDYAIFRCLYGFFSGVILQFAFQGFADFKPKSTVMMSCFELLATISVICFIYAVGVSSVSLIAPMVFSLSLFVFALEGGVFSRFLLARPLQWLGEVSYTLYISHAFVILGYAKFLRVLKDQGKTPIATVVEKSEQGDVINLLTTQNAYLQDILVICILVSTLVLCYFLHYFFEKPMQQYFNRIARNS